MLFCNVLAGYCQAAVDSFSWAPTCWCLTAPEQATILVFAFVDRLVGNGDTAVTGQDVNRVLPLRKLIHLAGSAFPLLYLYASREVVLLAATIALVITVLVEWGRQHSPALERLFEWFLGPALREGEERKLTTGTWSMLGILISVLFFAREVAIPAMFYAQLGDPAAEIVGRRWGRHRMSSGKSLEGSLGCFITCAAVGLACSRLVPLGPGVAILGAFVATIVEVLPLALGDNLLMAPLSGLAMKLATLVAR
jgi:dolichol kinase